ncbi:MAG TPA: hypothetical protein VGH29_13750 [Candidatus Binataceae bacterium]
MGTGKVAPNAYATISRDTIRCNLVVWVRMEHFVSLGHFALQDTMAFMDVTLHIPDEFAQRLKAAGGDGGAKNRVR